MFDRRSLERRYKVKPNPKVYWHTDGIFHDEAEEEVWTDINDIHEHLVGHVSGPTTQQRAALNKIIPISRRKLKREYRKQIEARLLKLTVPHDPDYCLTRSSKLMLEGGG